MSTLLEVEHEVFGSFPDGFGDGKPADNNEGSDEDLQEQDNVSPRPDLVKSTSLQRDVRTEAGGWSSDGQYPANHVSVLDPTSGEALLPETLDNVAPIQTESTSLDVWEDPMMTTEILSLNQNHQPPSFTQPLPLTDIVPNNSFPAFDQADHFSQYGPQGLASNYSNPLGYEEYHLPPDQRFTRGHTFSTAESMHETGLLREQQPLWS